MNKTLRRTLTAAAWIYFAILFSWLILSLATGDHHGIVALANMLAEYLFFPLPLLILTALFLRRKEIWAGSILGIAIFLWLWGGLFIPQPRHAQASSQTLNVMTFNVLGFQTHTAPQIAAIRASHADLVFLQELNPDLAQAIQTDLANEYPYQVLQPATGVAGMGVLSKYPIQPGGKTFPLPDWVGAPQVLQLNWNNQAVDVINFHMAPVDLRSLSRVVQVGRLREAQAQALVDFAQEQSLPMIFAGDANATPLSDVYRTLTGPLRDSWMEAGYGFGHTFPGSDISGSSRPHFGPWAIPQWLVRIDYVFHSPQWRAVEAHPATFDGVSDHRGVIVTLALEPAK